MAAHTLDCKRRHQPSARSWHCSTLCNKATLVLYLDVDAFVRQRDLTLDALRRSFTDCASYLTNRSCGDVWFGGNVRTTEGRWVCVGPVPVPLKYRSRVRAKHSRSRSRAEGGGCSGDRVGIRPLRTSDSCGSCGRQGRPSRLLPCARSVQRFCLRTMFYITQPPSMFSWPRPEPANGAGQLRSTACVRQSSTWLLALCGTPGRSHVKCSRTRRSLLIASPQPGIPWEGIYPTARLALISLTQTDASGFGFKQRGADGWTDVYFKACNMANAS